MTICATAKLPFAPIAPVLVATSKSTSRAASKASSGKLTAADELAVALTVASTNAAVYSACVADSVTRASLAAEQSDAAFALLKPMSNSD